MSRTAKTETITVRLSAGHRRQLDAVAQAQGRTLTSVLERAIAEEAAKPEVKAEARRLALRDRARELYGDDELAVDDDARISESEDGAWVQAWVWLATGEMGQ